MTWTEKIMLEQINLIVSPIDLNILFISNYNKNSLTGEIKMI